MSALEVGVVPRDVDDRTVAVGDAALRYLRKGSGPSLVYLHDSVGNIGWLPLFDDLASSFDVVVPDLPGFRWVGVSDVGPQHARHRNPDCATARPARPRSRDAGRHRVRRLDHGRDCHDEPSLVATDGADRGRRPQATHGEIADQMLRGALRYGLGGFRDAASFRRVFGIVEEEVDDVPDALVPTVGSLHRDDRPGVLEAVDVQPRATPLARRCAGAGGSRVGGEDDRLFPLDIGHQYVERLPDARLHLVADAGHWVDLEQPEALANPSHRGLR